MDGLSARINGVEPGFQGLGEPAESFLQSDVTLPDLFVGIRTPTADARTPGSEASRTASTSVQHTLIASSFMLLLAH